MTHYNGNESESGKLFHRSESVPTATKHLIEMMDLVEDRVKLLRQHASALESERDSLLTMLSAIKTHRDLNLLSEAEKEEVEINTERLLNRLLTVEVTVTIPRNETQQRALVKVNVLCDGLLKIVKTDPTSAYKLLEEFINACISDCRGPYSQKFQAAVLECTVEDQKEIRRKLEALKAEKEEVELNTERLLNRLLTVGVTVTIPRNEFQQKALVKVNVLCDGLFKILKADPTSAYKLLEEFINACTSDCRGPYNQNFQAAVLECTVDDQKAIRKKLEALKGTVTFRLI